LIHPARHVTENPLSIVIEFPLNFCRCQCPVEDRRRQDRRKRCTVAPAEL
jgi:hypothetical protein